MQNGRKRSKNSRTGRTERRSERIPGREIKYSILGKDHVWFTRHALERMEQRGVDVETVLAVLKNPSRKGLPTQPGAKRWALDRVGKKSVEVVFRLGAQQVFIITVIKT